MPTTHRETWSAIQEEHASRQLLFLDSPKSDYWHAYLEPEGATYVNGELSYFLRNRLAFSANGRRWEEMTERLDWRGYLMPWPEMERLGEHRIREVTETLAHRRAYFRWNDYLSRLVGTDAEVGIAANGLWQFVLFYNGMLHRARGQGVRLERLFQRLPEEPVFANHLPGAQCVALLLYLCRKPFAQHFNLTEYEGMLAAAWPAVQTFFAEQGRACELHFAGGNTEDNPRLRTAFLAVLAGDAFPVALQKKLGGVTARGTEGDDFRQTNTVEGVTSLREFISDLAARIGLKERIRNIGQKRTRHPAAAPNYGPAYVPLAKAFGQKWYEQPTAVREVTDKQKRGAAERCEEQYRRYLNHLTAPVLNWYWNKKQLLVRWHVAPLVTLTQAAEAYRQEQELIRLETQQLDELLFRLQSATSLAFVKKLENEHGNFRSATVLRRWREAKKAQRRKLEGRKRYRAQRMREFGIADEQLTDLRKEVWLDEMLKIEEEVRPYMAYVRRAFQAALPVGTTTEFNPYRHRHDGIEFDPETIQDADKWLRGEVMKTLRTRKDFAPITQVNTLCLDYSRSMTHDLMRSLYKTVFLLITGLESRKTYDAIHFFGSGFHEVAGFENTDIFTDRKILFKVLRTVAQQGGGKIIYGGVGGTNISAGVAESHKRLNEFVARLRKEKPEARVVESLFVLTDGQPTMGLTDLQELHDFIEEKRQDGNVAIKGIYLKHPDDKSDFITEIFGAGNAVSADSFEDTVMTFVQVMSRTYQEQRRKFRAAEKRRKMQRGAATGAGKGSPKPNTEDESLPSSHA